MFKETGSVPERIKCHNCRESLPVDANYCSNCSTPQKEGVESRRQEGEVISAIPGEVIEISSEMSENCQLARREILESIKSKDDGINHKRIKKFLNKFGLEWGDMLVLSDTDISLVNGILESHRLPSLNYKEGDGGTRYVDIGISFVYRNEEYIQEYGHIDLERTIIHELAHGNSGYQGTVYREGDASINTSTLRVGFKPVNSFQEAIFLEEGFAEFMSSLYQLELDLDESLISRFIGKITKITKRKDLNIIYTVPETGRQIVLPYKYRRSVGMSTRAIPATALESILDADDELFNIMLRARKDVNALREFLRRVDAIDPGLYIKLRKLRDDQEDFAEGYEEVQIALMKKNYNMTRQDND